MQGLQTDFIRFGGLHSWYKHIPLMGKEEERTIYFRKQKGVQEPKYSETEDDSEHWWFFIQEKPEDDNLGTYYKAIVGPMLSSAKLLEDPEDEFFNSSMHIIKSYNPLFEEWLKENYPEEYETSTMEDLIFFKSGRKICLSECKKYWDNLLIAFDFVKKFDQNLNKSTISIMDQKYIEVELAFSCKNLKDTDGIGNKSDPVVIVESKSHGIFTELGRTEVVKDNLNPTFKTTVKTSYRFQDIQPLKISVWDMDDNKLGELLGSVEVLPGNQALTLGRLVSSGEITTELSKGTITIVAEEISDCKDLLVIKMKGKKLPKKDGLGPFGKSDPYVKFIRLCGDSGKEIVVHTTKIKKGTVNPDWGKIAISVDRLCKGDYQSTIKLECWDWDRMNQDDFMCQGNLRMSELKHGGEHELEIEMESKKGKSAGKLKLKYQITRNFTFVDFLQKGLKIQTGVFLDFTGSNGGDPRDPNSLHFLRDGFQNKYQQSMSGLMSVLTQYDQDQQIPLFGFGAKIKKQVSHCFPLDSQNPEVDGTRGVESTYSNFIQKIANFDGVQMSGPTYFKQIIQSAIGYALKDPKQYYVWIIMTDGEIMDLQETIEKMCQASEHPISFVILGIGGGDPGKGFTSMEVLDSDQQPLETANGRHKSSRDIVQFVESEKYQSNPVVMYQKILEEIPQQVEEFMRFKGFYPGQF